jgi:hypothetical protein
MSIAKYSVYNSVILDAPLEKVWQQLRNMSRLVAIAFGEGAKDFTWVEGGSPEKVPSRYQVTLVPSGSTLLDEVVGRSESEHSVTYSSINGGLLEGYVATYRLRPVTNEPGKTFLEWPREFGIAPGGDPAVIVPLMEATTAGHVAALKKYFARYCATPA